MRRVTSKQKRARLSIQSSAHLVFTSDRHREDREAADRLRAMPVVPRISRGEFPEGKKIAFQGHFCGENTVFGDRFERQPEVVFVAENLDNKRLCSWYVRKDSRETREGQVRKEKTGLYEINVALSSGVALALAEAVRAGKDIGPALEAAGKAGMAKTQELTGYIPVYLCCHPDAEGTVSFHLGFSPVDPETRQLVGISATGKRGKKGLRLLGDAFLSIHRHARFVKVPDRMLALSEKAMEEGRNADWKIGEAMDEAVFSVLGKEFEDRAKELGAVEAREWIRRAVGERDLVPLLQKQVVELMGERDELKAKNAALEKRVDTLEQKLEKVGRFLGGTEPDMSH